MNTPLNKHVTYYTRSYDSEGAVLYKYTFDGVRNVWSFQTYYKFYRGQCDTAWEELTLKKLHNAGEKLISKEEYENYIFFGELAK